MPKVRQEIYLKRETTADDYEIVMPDKETFKKKILYHFGLKTKTLVRLIGVFERADTKTAKQLGYFHIEVLPKTMIAYIELGWPVGNEKQAKELLKQHSGYYDEITNIETGETIKTNKSIASAKIDAMIHLIEYAINEVCALAGVEVLPPKK